MEDVFHETKEPTEHSKMFQKFDFLKNNYMTNVFGLSLRFQNLNKFHVSHVIYFIQTLGIQNNSEPFFNLNVRDFSAASLRRVTFSSFFSSKTVLIDFRRLILVDINPNKGSPSFCCSSFEYSEKVSMEWKVSKMVQFFGKTNVYLLAIKF